MLQNVGSAFGIGDWSGECNRKDIVRISGGMNVKIFSASAFVDQVVQSDVQLGNGLCALQGESTVHWHRVSDLKAYWGQ